jgi:hypothetical protein
MFSLPVAVEVEGPERGGAYIERRTGRPSNGERHIGIVWAGSPDHEQAHHRDCPLVYFLPLSEIRNVRLHALQVGPAQA